jgi:hypothetical protein
MAVVALDRAHQGVEAEVVLTPRPSLTFNINAVFASAKPTKDQVPDNVTPRATPARAGDRIPFIAPQTIFTAGTYGWSIGSTGGAALFAVTLTSWGSPSPISGLPRSATARSATTH